MTSTNRERILSVLREVLADQNDPPEGDLAKAVFELEAREQFTADRNDVVRRISDLVQTEVDRRLG